MDGLFCSKVLAEHSEHQSTYLVVFMLYFIYLRVFCLNNSKCCSPFIKLDSLIICRNLNVVKAQVIGKVNGAIHLINHYLADSMVITMITKINFICDT